MLIFENLSQPRLADFFLLNLSQTPERALVRPTLSRTLVKRFSRRPQNELNPRSSTNNLQITDSDLPQNHTTMDIENISTSSLRLATMVHLSNSPSTSGVSPTLVVTSRRLRHVGASVMFPKQELHNQTSASETDADYLSFDEESDDLPSLDTTPDRDSPKWGANQIIMTPTPVVRSSRSHDWGFQMSEASPPPSPTVPPKNPKRYADPNGWWFTSTPPSHTPVPKNPQPSRSQYIYELNNLHRAYSVKHDSAEHFTSTSLPQLHARSMPHNIHSLTKRSSLSPSEDEFKSDHGCGSIRGDISASTKQTEKQEQEDEEKAKARRKICAEKVKQIRLREGPTGSGAHYPWPKGSRVEWKEKMHLKAFPWGVNPYIDAVREEYGWERPEGSNAAGVKDGGSNDESQDEAGDGQLTVQEEECSDLAENSEPEAAIKQHHVLGKGKGRETDAQAQSDEASAQYAQTSNQTVPQAAYDEQTGTSDAATDKAMKRKTGLMGSLRRPKKAVSEMFSKIKDTITKEA